MLVVLFDSSVCLDSIKRNVYTASECRWRKRFRNFRPIWRTGLMGASTVLGVILGHDP